jgi:hypothetical protein
MVGRNTRHATTQSTSSKIGHQSLAMLWGALGPHPDHEPVESVFATVRLRHDKTTGCGTRMACLTMVLKLMESASKGSQSLNGWRLLAEVV